jgi:glycosyltransferase involved in cell wall biosynthesis
MKLNDITPYILTYNEEANIKKCLEGLRWAKDVVIFDSFSDDRTLVIASEFQNTRVIQRAFDSHSRQHAFALDQMPESKWVLRLDADWVVTPELLLEIEALDIRSNVGGVCIPFLFSIYGEMAPIGMYPTVVALFKREGSSYIQDGHTERLVHGGDVVSTRASLIHEDKKPLDRFLQSQIKYSKLEATKIDGPGTARQGMKAKLRKVPGLVALLVALYLLFWKGGLFRGRASMHYVLQRLVAELTLSLRILDERIRSDHMEGTEGRGRTPF